MFEEEEDVCVHCGGTPCEWDELGPELLEREQSMHSRQEIEGVIVVVDDNGSRIANNDMRRAMYRMFTYIKFGHLGRGVRIPIPECVLCKIRQKYPKEDGEYMGFKEAPATEGEETSTSPKKQK